MQLVLYPDPVLRKRAAPVSTIDGGLRERVRRMFEIMYEESGVGLAAPQVGWSTRLFVVNPTGEPDPGAERVYINPVIRESEGDAVAEEGCLSLPGIHGNVKRSQRIVVEAYGADGQEFREEASDLTARVIQHELDHLDGILFISRLSVAEKIQAKKVLKKLERQFKSAGEGSRGEGSRPIR